MLKIATKILENKTIRDALAKNSFTFKELSSTVGARKHTVTAFNVPSAISKNYKILASKTGSTEEAGVVTFLLIEATKTKKQYIVISMGGTDLKNKEVNKIAKWIAEGNVKIANTTK